ncbi:methyltransferase domain-containing protein [Streptomyces sp. NPDC046197]|uniref:class I SAM-dependent methyltransferase n=1 Tax=Streptomyces sp. NPDC046197 TaxID=3154337 RepID=UPI0033D5E408
MFSPEGPSLRELAVQALSSVERGYDLLAPKFDHTPFRTPDRVLDAVAVALEGIGPFDDGLDLCCGTGAGVEVLARVCRESVTGVDFSAGMLEVARRRSPVAGSTALPVADSMARPAAGAVTPAAAGSVAPPAADPVELPPADPLAPPAAGSASAPADGVAGAPSAGLPVVASASPRVGWVRGDARALPFTGAFDLVVSFGAFGHFLPRELPALFGQVHSVLRPGGVFAFPVLAPPRPGSPLFWTLLGFDAVMRVRNAVWRPRFVMYYRALRFGDVCRELERAGFRVEFHALPAFGRRGDGSPRARMIAAHRPTSE